MDDQAEIEVETRSEPFTCPQCHEEVGANEVFTLAPSDQYGLMVVRCAGCSPRLMKELA